MQGVRRASYLDVSPEAFSSDGPHSRVSPALGGGRGSGSSRRASVCMAAEALMAGIRDKDSREGAAAAVKSTGRAPPLGDVRSVDRLRELLHRAQYIYT